jgi:hypothetical protein
MTDDNAPPTHGDFYKWMYEAQRYVLNNIAFQSFNMDIQATQSLRNREKVLELSKTLKRHYTIQLFFEQKFESNHSFHAAFANAGEELRTFPDLDWDHLRDICGNSTDQVLLDVVTFSFIPSFFHFFLFPDAVMKIT